MTSFCDYERGARSQPSPHIALPTRQADSGEAESLLCLLKLTRLLGGID